jgi:hypothetical protein
VLKLVLVEMLAAHFAGAGCGLLNGYAGDLRSSYVRIAEARRRTSLVHEAGMAIFDRLPRALRSKIGGFEWWVHRRPWHDGWAVGSNPTMGQGGGEEDVAAAAAATAPKVIPGMRLHRDGDHTTSTGSLYTSLLFLGDPVGSPTVVVKTDTGRRAVGAWFFEGVAGDVLSFDGGAFHHGALPAMGTLGEGSRRIVMAFAWWGGEAGQCTEAGRVCRGGGDGHSGIPPLRVEEEEEEEDGREDTDGRSGPVGVETCTPMFL